LDLALALRILQDLALASTVHGEGFSRILHWPPP